MPDQVITDGSIQEGQLRFTFSSNHQVIKFDETPVYRKLEKCVDQTKGIDILGLQNEESLLMIEAKDYAAEGRGSEKTSHVLTEEVAQKVRDSCAAIVHGSRMATHDKEFWNEVGNTLFQSDLKIQVILWIELSNNFRLKGDLSGYNQKLKQKLKWLKANIIVASPKTSHPISGLEVTYTR